MPSSTPHTVCQPMATGTNLSKTATSALPIVGHSLWATRWGNCGAQVGHNRAQWGTAVTWYWIKITWFTASFAQKLLIAFALAAAAVAGILAPRGICNCCALCTCVVVAVVGLFSCPNGFVYGQRFVYVISPIRPFDRLINENCMKFLVCYFRHFFKSAIY